LAGWRHVEVTARRTKQDYAHQMQYLVDVRYPDAQRIIVVHDQPTQYPWPFGFV